MSAGVYGSASQGAASVLEEQERRSVGERVEGTRVHVLGSEDALEVRRVVTGDRDQSHRHHQDAFHLELHDRQ